MKLCYQVATPDVKFSPLVTSYQGNMEKGFAMLKELGYSGVELMIRNPEHIQQGMLLKLTEKYELKVPMVCTGEIFGQDGLSLIDEDESVRIKAMERLKKTMEMAGRLGGMVNLGRFRGHYYSHIPKEISYNWAIDAFRRAVDFGEKIGVTIALEPVNVLQTNFIKNTSEALEIIELVGSSKFQLMLDVFHMNIEDEDIYKSINKSAGKVCYIHLTDSNRGILGTCKFDFYKIIEGIKATGYDGYYCIEIFQIPDQETCARRCIEYLDRINLL